MLTFFGTLKQRNVNGLHKDAQGPWCQVLLAPQYVSSLIPRPLDGSLLASWMYTVSLPIWIEEDWRRISYLSFIEVNWTTAYKTSLLEWSKNLFLFFYMFFPILDFLRIKRHQSMYWITMRHILAQFIQLGANQFGEEYIFVFLLLKAWLGFHSLPKGITYASRR